MAFIPGFEYDIFISYAHVDNITLTWQTDGWIEQFYKNLNIMLAKRFGRLDLVKIWWDHRKLDGSIVFDQSIESGIQKTAIMICLNSPGYAASLYCKQELETFYKKAQKERTGLIVGERSRILNVLLNNIPFSQFPDELKGTIGFPFHDAKNPSDFGDTIDTHSAEFKTQLQKVRDALWNILNDFPKESSAVTTKEEVTVTDTMEARQDISEELFNIYIGEVNETLVTVRKRLIFELEKRGYKILAGTPSSGDIAAYEMATVNALQKADLVIHMLNEYPGREIEGIPGICYPQKQVELAMQSAKVQMIWVPAETDIENINDQKYKAFIQDLESKNSLNVYEFVRGSRSSIVPEIIDYIKYLKQPQSMVKNTKDVKLSVLIDTHFNDQIYAFNLGKVLQKNNIQAFFAEQDDDPRKNINLFSENLSKVQKLIFIYGNVSKEWLVSRVSSALQLIFTNNYPIVDIIVILGPPHKNENIVTFNQDLGMVKFFDASNNENIDYLTEKKLLSELQINTE